MKAFDVSIDSITKGPEELMLQIPVILTLEKQMAGKDRPDYFLGKLNKPIYWKDKEVDIDYVIICSKKKNDPVSKNMKDCLIAIAFVTDQSLLEQDKLDFRKCEYLADGKASAHKKWGFF